jgi:hypothetical protein
MYRSARDRPNAGERTEVATTYLVRRVEWTSFTACEATDSLANVREIPYLVVLRTSGSTHAYLRCLNANESVSIDDENNSGLTSTETIGGT